MLYYCIRIYWIQQMAKKKNEWNLRAKLSGKSKVKIRKIQIDLSFEKKQQVSQDEAIEHVIEKYK